MPKNDPAPEPQEQQGPDVQEQPKKKKTGLILGVVGAQLVILALVVYFVLYPMYQERMGTGEMSAKEEKKPEKKEMGLTYTISDLTVNPKNTNGRRFAVFEIVLEVEEASAIEELKKYHPIIKDRFIEYLRSKTVEELASQVYYKEMKKDLIDVTNIILGKKDVDELYFTRYVLE